MSDTTTDNTTASTANRLRLSAMTRSLREQSAQQAGDENTLWQEARSMVFSINARLGSPTSPPHPPELLDIDMHDLWHIYWHGAINTAPDSPKLDRLALQVIQVREQGVRGPPPPVRRKQPPMTRGAVTSDGSEIWSDLPFLVPDMLAHWTRDCAVLGRDQRLSGAQFLALLAAAGADDEDALCRVALVVLRDALETARPLGRLAPSVDGAGGGGGGRDPQRQMRDLSIADLLPAANAWLFAAGQTLVDLSDAEWQWVPVGGVGEGGELGELGELVRTANDATIAFSDAEETQSPSSQTRVETGTKVSNVAGSRGRLPVVPGHRGFSPERWVWWLRRLEEMESMAKLDEHADEVGVGGRTLAGFVRGMINNMIIAVEGTSGRVWELLQQSGGVERYRTPMQRLGLARPAAPEADN